MQGARAAFTPDMLFIFDTNMLGGPMNLLRLTLFVLVLALGSGCRSFHPDNMLATLIEERMPLQGTFSGDYVRRSDPSYFDYETLRSLIEHPKPEGALAQQLDTFWRTPIIDNEAWYAGHRPELAANQTLGTFLRFTQWNIEQSLEMPRVIEALSSPEAYAEMISPRHTAEGDPLHERMMRQRARLAASDIIILEEMDIGLPRSGYRDAAGELAGALNMNYAYGVQYLEIDPVQMGLEPPSSTIKGASTEIKEVDTHAYKGLFGSAILSRYPIKQVTLHPLKYQAHDWHSGELDRFGPLEKGRRLGSELLFKNTIHRELKVGGRNFFRIDLEVPGLPDNTLSVIVIHLEIKCPPKARDAQIQEILGYIKDIPHPVIMAGDFNSAPSDISKTSVLKVARHTLANPRIYLSLALNVATTFGTFFSEGRWLFNATKNYHSPLAADIPVIAPNPIRPMFDHIEAFRFRDGQRFDWAGNREHSINGASRALANSNQRDIKGHVTSFTVRRPLGPVGKYRLDWIFVKHPPGPDRFFAPTNGETLKAFNKYLVHPFSDHRACIVDLPFPQGRVWPVGSQPIDAKNRIPLRKARKPATGKTDPAGG
ncbi:MAG: endonuclease/exonuclease/phosphatase family metal-dependent hydrolase [Kiritimatiellia bacterium]|jgi:endonuclease/exonuclease/phosphatase family metal-dependent hydrolase